MPQQTYDPDADEKYDSQHLRSAEYQASQDNYDREFNNIVNNYGDTAEHPLGSDETKATSPAQDSSAAQSGPGLDQSEKKAADDSLNYTGGGQDKANEPSGVQGFMAKLNGSSKLKKRVMIAGAAAGGSLIGGVLIFLAMLPLKIEHIVTNLENKFSATAQDAVGKETEKMLSRYLAKYVLPGINNNLCKSTRDATCVGNISGTDGPVKRLFESWKGGKLETKLANKYNIVLGKKDGQLFMNIDGHLVGSNKELANLMEHPTQYSIFDVGNSTGSGRATRQEVRTALRDALKDATLWDRTYFRFKVGKLIEAKYGVKRCVIACDARDKFNDTKEAKTHAAKAYIVRRVISPLSESYGLIIQCLIGGGGACGASLDEADKNDTSRQTDFQKQLQLQLDSFADKYGSDKLAKLFDDAKGIGDKGFTRYFAEQIGKKIAGEVGGNVASKSVPVVGQVLLVARILKLSSGLGNTIKYMSYAANAAAAVALYNTYNTVASEMKSGHIDPTELGSFTQALGTNVNGTSENQSDATSTPLYNSYFGGDSADTASLLGGLFSGTVSAESTDSTYKCDDGSGVESGKLVCPEEQLNRGNRFADDISNTVNGTVFKVPGMSTLVGVINTVGDKVGGAFGTAFNFACKIAPGCSNATEALSNAFSGIIDTVVHKIISSPFGDNMSGGRTFDMMAAGADVSNNASCQTQLGCTKISDQMVADIRNQQETEQKQKFDSQSMFARIFDTKSSYSLVSRLAMDMPTTMLSATNASLASLFANPLGKFAGAFSSIFSSNRAFAATAAQPDPFGVVQYGYSDATIPSDPEAYWSANCIQGPMALYNATTQQLDISPWLNNDPHYEIRPKVFVDFTQGDGVQGPGPNTTQDPDTGEQVNLKSNPCQLIQSAVQSAGVIFDPGILPAADQNKGSD